MEHKDDNLNDNLNLNDNEDVMFESYHYFRIQTPPLTPPLEGRGVH